MGRREEIIENPELKNTRLLGKKDWTKEELRCPCDTWDIYECKCKGMCGCHWSHEDVLDRRSISPAGMPHPTRYHLPDERKSVTVHFKVHTQLEEKDENGFNKIKVIKGYFVVGLYNDGYPGELFVYLDKMGTEPHGWANAWSTSVSMLLQFGISPHKVYDKFKYRDFQPKGITNLKTSPICKSIVDLIMKYMEQNFPPTASDSKKDSYETAIESVISLK